MPWASLILTRGSLTPQAFSNFYYTFHFLNLTSRQPLNIVNDTVWKFCQTPWELVGDVTLDAALGPSPYRTMGKQGLWGLIGFSWTEIRGKAIFRY